MSKRIGVIVGRFQVPELHDGHKGLIDAAYRECDKVLVLIGTRIVRSANDPLHYDMVYCNVLSYLDEITYYHNEFSISKLEDHKSNKVWIENLISSVSQQCNYNEDEIVYYGSRNSFLDFIPDTLNKRYYSHVNTSDISGTEVRENLQVIDSVDFRTGYAMAYRDQFPNCPSVVDAIITKSDQILIGYKEKTKSHVIIGGFADDGDGNLESAVSREVLEESGLNIPSDDWGYVGSSQCDIWSYSRTRQPFTSCFTVEWKEQYGQPVAGDDLDKVEWMKFADAIRKLNSPIHLQFLTKVLKKIRYEHNQSI